MVKRSKNHQHSITYYKDEDKQQQQKDEHYHDSHTHHYGHGSNGNTRVKKQDLRGGTPTSTSTIRSTSSSNAAVVNNHRNNKQSNENTPTGTITRSSTKKYNTDDQHAPTLTLVDALSLATAKFPDHDNTDMARARRRREKGADNDNNEEETAQHNTSSKVVLERAQRKRATKARRKEHMLRQVYQSAVSADEHDPDDGEMQKNDESFQKQTSKSRQKNKPIVKWDPKLGSGCTNGNSVCFGAALAEFFLSAADCVESNCSPATLRRKASLFDCAYGQDPTNDLDAELYHERVYSHSFVHTYGESGRANATSSRTTTCTKQALVPGASILKTTITDAGQHLKSVRPAAASKIERRDADQSFDTGYSNGSITVGSNNDGNGDDEKRDAPIETFLARREEEEKGVSGKKKGNNDKQPIQNETRTEPSESGGGLDIDMVHRQLLQAQQDATCSSNQHGKKGKNKSVITESNTQKQPPVVVAAIEKQPSLSVIHLDIDTVHHQLFQTQKEQASTPTPKKRLTTEPASSSKKNNEETTRHHKIKNNSSINSNDL
jgi:hypothetical protein